MRDLMCLVLVTTGVAGCLSYGNGEGGEYTTCNVLADCNPGKECGEMIPCVDGRCEPDRTVEVPCHTACRSDDDCLLAFEDCCGGSSIDAYVAVRADKLDDWMHRQECQDILCEPCYYCPFGDRNLCWNGDCIQAVCVRDEGVCAVAAADPRACDQDGDCAKVPGDCCGCANGGLEAAVNQEFEEAYLLDLGQICARVDPACYAVDLCTDLQPVCKEGQCGMPGDGCECPHTWDPVCVLDDGELFTLANECQATCRGLDWVYHGDCACRMDCDCDVCGCAVCADNGVTYPCGAAEAECNGQGVAYEGECAPGCETCALLGRPPIPVCDQDFCSRSDLCYVECRGRDWWHQGACLPGEGARCGTIAGIPCGSESLFCLPEENVPDAEGVCIQLGACREAEHCTFQPLAHDDCDGDWACADHVCVWECR